MLPPATALLPTWQNEGRSGFLVLCLLAGIPMPEEMLRVIVTSVTMSLVRLESVLRVFLLCGVLRWGLCC